MFDQSCKIIKITDGNTLNVLSLHDIFINMYLINIHLFNITITRNSKVFSYVNQSPYPNDQ